MGKGIPDAPDVKAGFCRKGCGRPVAPGKTRSGKNFDTCCRGCVLGFGHDLHCGKIDASKVGPGKCKYGCGRPVNPGRHASGQAYDTCCRTCVRGVHDESCGKQSPSNQSPVAEGKCKMGCGRNA